MKKTPTLIIAGLALTAIGATQVAPYLTPTGVTPGSYTAANITVNAFGQLTAAANGSGGTNSGGDVYTSSNNVFTGTNTFSAPTAFSTLTIGTLTVQTNATIPNTTLTNGVAFGQSDLAAHSAGTNFVVDPTINQYQLITISNTNAVRFLHLTNAAIGRQTTVIINVTTNTTVSVALGANQFANTTNLFSLTQGQILPISFYCYGSNNTNVIASVPTLPFVYR